MFKIKILILALVIIAAGGLAYKHTSNNKPALSSSTQTAKTAAAAAKPVNYCAGNTLDQEIIVSISKQHLWACDGTTISYDNPVITGMQMYPADLTPTGTYKIYGRQTGQYLAGHDSTGSWDDYVNYWMPFLDNQYGTYGFHDLTQTANGANGRADTDFGNIDINAPYTAAKHGSHGCVEMPLAAMKWLYDWASVGTTVTIQS